MPIRFIHILSILVLTAFVIPSALPSQTESHNPKTNTTAPTSNEATASSSNDHETPHVRVIMPLRATVGETFIVYVRLEPGTAKAITVTMGQNENVSYTPSSFKLHGDKEQLVRVQVHSSRTGVVRIRAFAEGYAPHSELLDLGFLGVLKTDNNPINYNTPTTRTIEITLQDGTPLSLESNYVMRLQSNDAFLFAGNTANPPGCSVKAGLATSLPLDLTIGTSASPQFQMLSCNKNGGTAHLAANLTNERGGISVHHDFTFVTRPAPWLTMALAMGGGALYALFSLRQVTDTKTQHAKPNYILLVLSGLSAGVLAWLCDDRDLFQLKLDPSVLKTYFLLGVLFSYFGIDVVFKKFLFPVPAVASSA